ncbi:hypothetical protein [Methylobacterium sp. E-016]|nr:hypothetical protein [Methylobacterium sp. E-016]
MALELKKRELAVSAVSAKLRVAAQQSENDRFPDAYGCMQQGPRRVATGP